MATESTPNEAEKAASGSCDGSAGGLCPTCKDELWPEYGYCKFGLGAFKRCPTCLDVFDFFREPD